MDKEEKIQSILKALESEIRQWVEEESSIKYPILYDRKRLERSVRFGKTLMVKAGATSKDRNLKKK